MSRYVVVGGGVSGLAAARVLAGARPVSDVAGRQGDPEEGETWPRPGSFDGLVLLEASDVLGGKVLTSSFAGGPVELGPDQFLRRDPSAERLCRLLGLGGDLVAPGVGAAAVFAAGMPRRLPAGLALGIPTDLDALSASGIVSRGAVDYARAEAERPGPLLERADVGWDGTVPSIDPARERSAGAILRPRLGDEIVDLLVDPLIGGINAGSIDNLSLGTVAPQIARALVGHKDVIAPLAAAAVAGSPAASPFLGLAGGLGRFVAAAGAELRLLGCEVRLACPALRVRSAASGPGYVVETAGGEVAADGVVLALPAGRAASLIEEVVPTAAGHLGEISYSNVAVVTFAVDRPVPDSLGGLSGVLVPRREGTLTTAVTLLSQKWPWMSAGRARSLVRVSAGRHLDARIDSLADAELSRTLAEELAVLTGISADPEDCLVQRWKDAFPQYAPGYAARLRGIDQALAERPGLALAGASLGGIGIPACITSGERAAETIRGSAVTWA
ncbi:MAG TPA: protoporphyrinogen oxidase [Acidimicrobiales bacterium]|nr:protoporphyrinogen oxidase [Acidimicrobiales bacterium]